MSILTNFVLKYTAVNTVSGIFFLSVATMILVFSILTVVKVVWERSISVLTPSVGLSVLRLPPGTMGYPVIGETFEFFRKRSRFYKEKYEQYGNIYKTHILGNPTIRVIGAENVKEILNGENTIVTQYWPTSSRLLLGTGSISQATGYVHKVRRRHILRAFGLESLNGCIPTIQDIVKDSLQAWTQHTVVRAYPECKKMTFSIAASALLGMDKQTIDNGQMHNIFYEFLANLMTIPFDLPGFGFRKGMNAKRRLIQDLKTLFPGTKTSYTPLMQRYYENCKQLGQEFDLEFYEGIIDLLFAGHETLASSTTNSIMFLGKHRRVVDKLREELREHNLLNENDVDNSELTYRSTGDLKYLNAVVKEVLRLCPPAGGGFRKALKSFELGGYLIPKDWTIIYSIRETQHTSPIFEHAEDFDPDRWEKIAADSTDERFHYIPFGFGARGCVGKLYAQLVLNIFIIELVRNCKWKLMNVNPEMSYIPIAVATDHLPVSFRKRNGTSDQV